MSCSMKVKQVEEIYKRNIVSVERNTNETTWLTTRYKYEE